MKRMIENMTGAFGPSASVVDGTLIITLPDAITPVAWRLELGQTKASAMEVRENGKAGDKPGFTLILKTPKGDVQDIATYETKMKAVQALMTISHAMENAHGHIRAGANDRGRPQLPAIIPGQMQAAAPKHRAARGILMAVLGVAVLLIGASALMRATGPRYATLNGDTAAAGAADTAASIQPAMGGSAPGNPGVPESADSFLQKQQ